MAAETEPHLRPSEGRLLAPLVDGSKLAAEKGVPLKMKRNLSAEITEKAEKRSEEHGGLG